MTQYLTDYDSFSLTVHFISHLFSFYWLACQINDTMVDLPLEIQLQIIDAYLHQAVDDILYLRRVRRHCSRRSLISCVMSMALTSKLFWCYISLHPDYGRLRLVDFLDSLTRIAGERHISIHHGTHVTRMKAWSSSVFDGIAHGDLFFVENAEEKVGCVPTCQVVPRLVFLNCVELWARMNSYRVGVYLQKDVKQTTNVDSDSVLRFGPQQRITRIRV
jgi:hypothetical protein